MLCPMDIFLLCIPLYSGSYLLSVYYFQTFPELWIERCRYHFRVNDFSITYSQHFGQLLVSILTDDHCNGNLL